MSKVSTSDFVSFAAEMLSQLTDLAHEHGMPELRDAIAEAHAVARDSQIDAALRDVAHNAAAAGRGYRIASGFGG